MPKKKSHPKQTPKKVTKLNQRDEFFHDHPHARVLLGIFIVSVAIFIGVLWRNYQFHKAVAEILGAEDIVYHPSL